MDEQCIVSIEQPLFVHMRNQFLVLLLAQICTARRLQRWELTESKLDETKGFVRLRYSEKRQVGILPK